MGGEPVPEEAQLLGGEGVGLRLEFGDGAVDLGFVGCEEGREVLGVEVGGALGLRDGEVEEEERLEEVVERDPECGGESVR